MEFTCATAESGVTSFGISTTPAFVDQISVPIALANGGRQQILSFFAPSGHSSITITCVAIRLPDVNETTAILMIQGKIVNTCSIYSLNHFTQVSCLVLVT